MIRRLLRLIYQLIAIIPYVIVIYFWWLLRYSIHPEKYPLELRYMRVRKLIRTAMRILHVEYHVSGVEKLAEIDGNFMLIPNHLSNFDPVVLIAVCPTPITFVSKIEARRYPIIGRCIRALEGKFFDRGDLRQQLKVVKYVETDMLEKRRNWVIFPEGTRNRDSASGELLPFHSGSFRIPMNNDFTIVPVSIFGTNRVFDKKFYRRIPVDVMIDDPFKASYYPHITSSADLAQFSKDIIFRNLQIIKEEDKIHIANLKRRKKDRVVPEPRIKEAV